MSDGPAGLTHWLTLVLLCGCAVLNGLLDVMFLGAFYIGGQIVPLVLLAAIAGNVMLPVWGFRLLRRAPGAVLPVACWLVTVLGLALSTRPEGDVLVIAAYGQQGAFYALLLLGAAAGLGAVVVTGRGTRVTR